MMNEAELIKGQFGGMLRQIERLLRKGSTTVAIEGGSASGKTTLGRFLEDSYKCTVFHMDDFFLRPEQRTKQRLAEPGGNVDRERFLQEVLLPLKEDRPICYRRFDCSTFSLLPAVSIKPEKLVVVEGAYSMHPDFTGYYDFSVFLNIEPTIQKKRIQKRNTPKQAERFFQEWIPLEQHYFAEMKVKERCDMVIDIN
ncbi:MAG: uridine kinase [Lachnospiraceae bacterium]|jgi:uridine kinase|nr:uridine kinase [Lachnospiraceae bacterium]